MAASALGRNLRNAREARGWSRERLARESGTSVPAIARTELSDPEPRLSTIYAWAQALQMSPTDLLPSAEVHDLDAEVQAAISATEEKAG